MPNLDVEMSDSETSLESVTCSKIDDSGVVEDPKVDVDIKTSPTYITIETTDGQLEHVKVRI